MEFLATCNKFLLLSATPFTLKLLTRGFGCAQLLFSGKCWLHGLLRLHLDTSPSQQTWQRLRLFNFRPLSIFCWIYSLRVFNQICIIWCILPFSSAVNWFCGLMSKLSVQRVVRFPQELVLLIQYAGCLINGSDSWDLLLYKCIIMCII